MRLYHPLVLDVVRSLLQEAAEEKQAVQGYVVGPCHCSKWCFATPSTINIIAGINALQPQVLLIVILLPCPASCCQDLFYSGKHI